MKTARLVALVLTVVWGCNSLLGAGLPALAQAEVSQDLEQAWSLAVARDGQGTLWAAWEVDNGHDTEIYAAQWTGRDWSGAGPALPRPEAWDGAPSLAVAADGTLWLAWSSTLRSSPEKTRIYASRWTGEGWSSAEVLPEGTAFGGCASCGHATEPALAAAPDGTVWAAWVGADGQEENIFAQRWSGGVWSQPRQVSAGEGSPLLYDRQPQLAVGEDGRPWIAWTGNQADSDGVPIPGDDEIYASRWTGDAWTPEQMVSRDDESLDTAPSRALDAQGQAWIAWQARVTEDTVSGCFAAGVGGGEDRLVAAGRRDRRGASHPGARGQRQRAGGLGSQVGERAGPGLRAVGRYRLECPAAGGFGSQRRHLGRGRSEARRRRRRGSHPMARPPAPGPPARAAL